MSRWVDLFRKSHEKNHGKDDYDLFLGEPAQPDALEHARNKFELPDELYSLYREVNGVGLVRKGHPILLQIYPLEKLAEWRSSVVSWFSDSHPDISRRFVPVYDWLCGDATGYYYDEQKVEILGIYSFNHEEYSPDATEDAFIEPEDMRNMFQFFSEY